MKGILNTIRYTMDTVEDAAARMKRGAMVAVPTETVYGLAAHAEDNAAVRAVYVTKVRDMSKPLSILVTGMDMVETYAQNIPQAAYKLAETYWPGPLTMILESSGTVASMVTADGDTLGVRCPDHPMTQALIQALGAPLAAPSANPEGQPAPRTAQEVLDYFDGHNEGILDGGPCAVGVESTIVDLTGEEPRILREGGIPAQEILDFLKGLD